MQCFLSFFLFLSLSLWSISEARSQTQRNNTTQQRTDSTTKPATHHPSIAKDSSARTESSSIVAKDSATQVDRQWQLLTPVVQMKKDEPVIISKPYHAPSKDLLFYLMALLVLLLGLIRVMFPKYFTDLFGLFFRVTFKQKAMRNRLIENSLPSVIMNGMFYMSAGAFLYCMSVYFRLRPDTGFGSGTLFWTLLLLIVYSAKWTILKSMGWLFQVKEASDTYSFIVFMVNKVVGVMLIPGVILLTLGPDELRPVLVTFSTFLVGGLFLYRYVISYAAIRASVKLDRSHFFLYLCAFEVVPLLLIGKLLVSRTSMTF